MAKWADYLVSAASYDPDREITGVEVHEDLDGRMGPAEIIDKLTMSHNMRKGKSYVTIFRTLDSWRRGQEINMFSVGGNPYIRIDKNRVSLDNLGDIPDIDHTKKKDPSLTDTTPTGEKPAPPPPEPAGAPKPEARPPPEPAEPKPEPEPEPEPEPVEEKPASPHGTLPAAGEVGIPFEDVQPEPAPADAAPSEPEPEPPEAEEKPKAKPDREFLDYEQDYLRRLEEQRKREEELAEQARAEQAGREEAERQARLQREEGERQKHKAGTPKPEETAGSPRGSLPAEGEVAIPFEDVQPEPAPADAAPPGPEPPEVAGEPAPSPRGPLPADGEIDVPFEREQPPEAAGAEIGSSEGEEMDFDDGDGDEDPTPEQLARFEELERQLEEIIQQSEQAEAEPEPEEAGPEDLAKPKALEKQAAEIEDIRARADAEPEEPAGSPHGTLPADGEIEVPFEETQPEPVTEPDPEPEPGSEPEDEAVAEQYEQIAALSDKIRELETALANAPKIGPEPETVDGMIERLDETSDEQIEQLERLEEQIGEIEDADIESTILAKLHRQMDRLNAIEERISGSREATQEQIDRADALERQIAELEEKKRRADAASGVVAYCVRCKAKRSMSGPEETTMKNGRPATKGTCSVCGARMFRIGGSKPKEDDTPTKEQIDRVARLEKQIEDLERRQPSVSGYCVKCRSKRGMASPEQTTMKNGKPAVRGTCPVCGTGMFRIGRM